VALGVGADDGVNADVEEVGGWLFTEGLRLGAGFVGFVFGFGDLGVCGEFAWVGVGAFAAGVDAEAGGVDIEDTASEPTTVFFLVDAAAVRGLGAVG